MKQRLLLACSLLLAAAPAACLSAQTNPNASDDPARAPDGDDTAIFSEPRHIAFNLTPDEVVAAMHGEPHEKLSPHIWIYWHFELPRAPALRKYDTLVVFFSPERVVRWQLVERKVMAELLADVRRTPTPGEPEIVSECPRPPAPGEIAPALAPRRIGLGMSRDDVLRAMQGPSDEAPAPDVWIYWGFRVEADAAIPQPDTLLVFFAQGRVAKYRLVPRRVALALVAERKV